MLDIVIGTVIALVLSGVCFWAGMMAMARAMHKGLAVRVFVAKKQQLVSGNADEHLRLEGEIRAYERIVREGPIVVSE